MSAVVIGPYERTEIAALIAHAREHVLPWAVLAPSVVHSSTHTLLLEDRQSVPKRPGPRHLLLGNVEAAFSFEEQPAGICRHLSVALEKRKKGLLPSPAAVAMIAEAFGFTEFPPRLGRVWVEEYEPGRFAINVVEVAEPTAPGTLQ